MDLINHIEGTIYSSMDNTLYFVATYTILHYQNHHLLYKGKLLVIISKTRLERGTNIVVDKEVNLDPLVTFL